MLRKSILAAAFFALSASSSFAASRVWISEFGLLGATEFSGGGPAQIAALPAKVLQSTLDISGGTAQTSAAFGTGTRYIRIKCEVQCGIRADGIAATTALSIPLSAMETEYFGVQPGATISVIAAP